MLHRVRCLSFAQKAPAQFLPDRELGMQQLERDATAVSMFGFVNRGHPANPENALDSVLAAEKLPYARLGVSGEIVIGL
jgi:hypothetical protein